MCGERKREEEGAEGKWEARCLFELLLQAEYHLCFGGTPPLKASRLGISLGCLSFRSSQLCKTGVLSQ
ncbi:hypothetical protein ATANTOWER_019150 [Ataeniobius toweri]|uniref:Uncharacterized protein n=1 Tax=Ataeniobius toweri TaxID=208326 RepID=A0ABU7AAU4_9TELE|nr:hypothetical protein [Ataeniobius toweri]